MAAKPLALYELGETFHVPQFKVRIAGTDLPRDVVDDVLSVTYRDGVDDMAHFELLVNNWDADRRALKYETPSNSQYDRLFDPGRRVEVSMGYAGNLRLMVRGEITSLEPDFPASGGPTLAVGGLDVLHTLRTERHSASWPNTTDTDIAKKICQNPVRKGQPGLRIDLQTKPRNDEKPQVFVMQQSQFDVDFLLQRARYHDYELVLNEGADGGKRYLYFGVPDDPRRAATYRLEWGRTLLSFRMTVATSKQYGTLTLRAWDRTANAPMPSTVKWDELLPSGPVRDWVKRFANAFERRTDEVNRPLHGKGELEALTRDLMRERLQDLVTGTGSTVGLPGLCSGSRVVLQNLGPHFDGTYFVTQTTHTIGSGGYRTDFTARLDLV